MSFEGYYQIVCTKGHYSSEDSHSDYDPVAWKCKCGASGAWFNLVDITNGSFDFDNNGQKIRIDGYIELKVIKQDNCPHCGGEIGETIYEIPEKE